MSRLDRFHPARERHRMPAPEFTLEQVERIRSRLARGWRPPPEVRAALSCRSSEVATEKADAWPLRFLQFEPVNLCNFRCPLCRTLDRDDGVRRIRMPVDDFRRLIDPVADQLLAVVLYGNRGEPLLHQHLAEMVAYVHRPARALSVISTNGSLMTEPRAQELMEAGLSQVIFAIDGLTQESYGAYRVGGELEQVVANVRRFCEIRTKNSFPTHVVVQFIPMATNEHERDAVARFGYALGADEVRLKLSRSVARSESLRPSAARNRPAEPAPGGTGAASLEQRFDCPYGLDTMYVDPNGDCFPCCYAEGRGLWVGNALETPLDELWSSPQMWELRRGFVDQSGFQPFCLTTCRTRCRKSATYVVLDP